MVQFCTKAEKSDRILVMTIVRIEATGTGAGNYDPQNQKSTRQPLLGQGVSRAKRAVLGACLTL